MYTPLLYDTGYPHDGRANNTAYRHDRRADKRRYRHDREIDIQMLKMFRNGYILRMLAANEKVFKLFF